MQLGMSQPWAGGRGSPTQGLRTDCRRKAREKATFRYVHLLVLQFNMEVIGGLASIGQLIAYGHSAARCLQRLYVQVRDGPSIYQNEKSNIRVLLDVLDRLCTQGSAVTESVLALLVDISALACTIISLLQQRGLLGLNWAVIIGQRKLSEAFKSLTIKRHLLHLFIAENNHELLTEIREDVAQMSQNLNGPTSSDRDKMSGVTSVC